MKRFLILSTLVFALFFLIFLRIIPPFLNNGGGDESPFTIRDGQLYTSFNKETTPFQFIGMNVTSALPGSFPNEVDLGEETYLEWLQLIQELGVTVLRVPDLMPLNFYKALDKFNENRQEPLYLLQGIYMDDVALADGADLQQLEQYYMGKIKKIIDFMYGGAYPGNDLGVSLQKGVNLSSYLIGYSLGMEWANQDVIFSDIMNESYAYEGDYFYTSDSASNVEGLLAKLMDKLVSYEVQRYGIQHLVTVVGSNIEDFLVYKNSQLNAESEKYIGQTTKRNIKPVVDLNEIKPTQKLKSGYFASYYLYPVYSDKMGESIREVITDLQRFHEIPIMIAEYSLPSAKVVYEEMSGQLLGINEREQAEGLVTIYRTLRQLSILGSCLSEWQDRWDRTSFTTVDRVILDRSPYWPNKLTDLQSRGIYTFDASTDYPDHQIDEWKDKNVLSTHDGLTLSVKTDEEGIFFLIQSEEQINQQSSYWIDLDVTPNSGTKSYTEKGLTFENPVDFVININPNNQSRLLVQRYYHTYEFLKERTNLQIHPDEIKVLPDMDEFTPILIEVKPKVYNQEIKGFEEAVAQEAGRLIEGNANPDSNQFNSLANYYVGDNYIEIKIPWGLLNFSDPTNLKIHDDYYQRFGIDSVSINHLNIGLTVVEADHSSVRLPSEKYRLIPWVNPTYKSRFKLAYTLLQNEFRDK